MVNERVFFPIFWGVDSLLSEGAFWPEMSPSDSRSGNTTPQSCATKDLQRTNDELLLTRE